MIAGVLDISSWTVCTHLRRIFAKLNVTSRAAMVAEILKRPEQPSIGGAQSMNKSAPPEQRTTFVAAGEALFDGLNSATKR